MPGTSPTTSAPRRMRPALRVVSLVASVAIAALTVWLWLLAVPGALGNAGLPYMERVLSQVFMTFLLFLIGAGSVLLVLSRLRALEWSLRRRSDRQLGPSAHAGTRGQAP